MARDFSHGYAVGAKDAQGWNVDRITLEKDCVIVYMSKDAEKTEVIYDRGANLYWAISE